MSSIRNALILILFSMNLSALWAVDYGFRLSLGFSKGTGQEWNNMLDEAGDRGFADALGTLGAGIFAEIPLSPVNLFTPELSYVRNRGVHLSNGRDEYLKTAAVHSFELILPVTRIFPNSSENRTFRVMGGFQILYSMDLVESSRFNDTEETRNLENKTPLSLGLVLGTGMEFKRNEKTSWLGDIRVKIPFTDSLTYNNTEGSEVSLKTMEVLLGGGIKF